MNFEKQNNIENIPITEIEIEKDFESLVPEEFKSDPFGYFEREGRNIKSGEIQYDEQGVINEDPTCTKDLPVWRNSEGLELQTVGKKVNTEKSQVGKSGDPFYEYSIMEIAREFGLPAPIPVAKVKRNNEHLIVMEKIAGIRWTDEGMKPIHDANLTESDKQGLLKQAQEIINEIQQKYEQIGLRRNWKMKDMIFDVDIPNRKVLGVTPTDWERTKINKEKLDKAREQRLKSFDKLTTSKHMESEPRQFEKEKSPMREAYSLLGASTPMELSNLYTKQENPIFISREWDYDNPDQIQNKIKYILENVNESGLTEDEREWRDEILWFWYHHAISCANWKKDKEKMKEFSHKALEYQGNNPNILTRTMFLLAHDNLEEAEEWVQSKEGDEDHETALEFIENYKKFGFFYINL